MNQNFSSAELGALSAEAYMSQAQLDIFRQILCDEREALQQSAGEAFSLLPGTSVEADVSDRATLDEEESLELTVRNRESGHMAMIEQALARIEDGSYGWCKETGEAIGISRLLARPTAAFSVDVQERHEKLQKMEGR